MYSYVCVGALYVCAWFIKVAYTSILFIEQLFHIDLCHFSLEFIIHSCAYIGRSDRIADVDVDDGGGEMVFDLVLLVSNTRARSNIHFTLIHFNLQSLAPLEYLCNYEIRVENGGKMLKSVLKRGRCACMLLSFRRCIYLLVTPAFATK